MLPFFLLLIVLLTPQNGQALVSEGRPSIPYYNHPLFLDKKVIKNGQIIQVRLAYGDTRDDVPDCLNKIDVFQGLQLFAAAPEKSWVLVDYELQSIVIDSGFFGDADVFMVRSCLELDACVELREKLENDPVELAKRQLRKKPQNLKKARLGEIAQELDIGRKLVKAARCRGCHQVEGFGAEHAPSLTWKRFKYVEGWLQNYLDNPYRMRPAMNDLMMLRYTSDNARPALQEVESGALASYLERVAKAKTPVDKYRAEPWQNYDCYSCHTSNYQNKPLTYIPTPVPARLAKKLDNNKVLQNCLACHAFGGYRQVKPAGRENPNRLAPDLLLVMEKLDLNYLINYVQQPDFLQPGSKMPSFSLTSGQQEELRQFVIDLRREIEAGTVQPVHNYYRMERISD